MNRLTGRLILPLIALLFAASAYAQPTATPTPTATASPTVVGIAIQPAGIAYQPGAIVQLTLIAVHSDGSVQLKSDGTAQQVTATGWTSSAAGVATISNTGVLTAVAAGQTTITATFNGFSATSTVHIVSLVLGPTATPT